MASIDTLVADIQKLLVSTHKVDSPATEAFGKRVGEAVALFLANEKQLPRLRPSNIGKPCQRQLWYSVNESEKAEPLSPEVRMKFLFGVILEELLLFLAEEAGHTVTDRQKEVALDNVSGKLDARIDGVVVDCKSASSRSFSKFQTGLTREEDSFGYLDQLEFYARADGEAEGAFLAVDKQLGGITLDRHTFDSDASAFYRLVEEKKNGVLAVEPPPKGFNPETDGKSGNEKLGTVCSYCSFKDSCYEGLKVYSYSNGPRFLTKVVREPEVPRLR